MDEDIRIMRALREALGADFKLMIDAHWNYTVAQAVKLAHRLEELDVEFLECPLNPENLAGYSELAATVSIPVTLGEADALRLLCTVTRLYTTSMGCRNTSPASSQ